jgi:lysophospholipase-2
MYRLSTFRYRPSIVATFASTAFCAVAVLQHPSKFQRPAVVTTTTAMMMATTSSATSTATTYGKKGALIFLHGLGDGSPNGWEMSLEQELTRFNPKLSSDNIVYIFPNAPILPISINGGTRMPGWFDLYDWPVDLNVQDDEINMVQSISTTNDIITKCMNDYHFSREQIIIAGFSQGGAIALLTAYHPKYRLPGSTPLGGCINLSGWLPFRDKESDWISPSLSESTAPILPSPVPLFWGHGTYDDIVLIEHQKAGIEFLIERGLVSTKVPMGVQSLQYPVAHSSDPDEMKAMADFVDRILFPECDTATICDTNNEGGSKGDEL